ncbi:enhancin-1 [Spodoptera frugiperda granulovirus]|uniref:Enhancin-1 n=1 Tax=Spodoptera frugiperda granulovirus TaxID=307454 RepID=A0A0C5AUY7_9BBAC|nr:enhancin-1 [Spodoptera frugiperda granulovirus]AJK91788.1 enhancin-1 [Spodoptera frugiperda granulovirus]
MSLTCVANRAVDAKSYFVTVPTLKVPSFMRQTDTWIALHHNRVPVGVMTYTGVVVRCRIAAGWPAIEVRLRFLNNDGATEASVMVTSNDFVSHTLQHDSVLFVDYTLDSSETRVEVVVEGDVFDLPIFNSITSVELDFKGVYAGFPVPYALLELNAACILVPPDDKFTVIMLDLHELDHFYTQIVNLFNDMAGFRKDEENAYKVRFFVKADISGAGQAYYGRSWTAFSGPSLMSYLQVRPTNWLVFHELGHAYDMVFIAGNGLAEVWNNVYGDRMQYMMMNAAQRQTLASVYENGNRARIENQLIELIETYVPFQQWSFFRKLAFFVFIMNSGYGMEMWREINRQMRIIRAAQSSPVFPNVLLWLLELCSADLGAYYQLCNIQLPQYTAAMNYLIAPVFPYLNNIAQSKPALYPIKFLIEDFDLNDNKYSLKLYLESNLDLVRPQQLTQANLPFITLVIRCVINDVQQVAGEMFGVYDGGLLVYEALVDDTGGFRIPRLTPGVYTMRPPRGKDRRYTISFQEVDNPGNYIIVTTSSPSTDVRELIYEEIDPFYFRDVGHALGLNDVHSVSFFINYITQEIEVHVINRVINTHYGESIYFRLEISEPNAEFVIRGNGANIEQNVYVYKFVPNVTTITLRHLQASLERLIFMHRPYTSSPVTFRLLDNNVEAVTANTTIPSKMVRTKEELVYYSAWLDQRPIMIDIENEIRDKILLLVQSVQEDEEDYQLLKLEYNKYFPNYYRDVGEYRIDYLGYDDIVRIRYECNLLKQISVFTTFTAPNGPNADIGSNFYFSFGILRNNAVVFNAFFNGDQPITYKTDRLSIEDGLNLMIVHTQPERIKMYRNGQQLDVTFSSNNILTIEGNRLLM